MIICTPGTNSKGMCTKYIKGKYPNVIIDMGVPLTSDKDKDIRLLTHHHCDHDKCILAPYHFGLDVSRDGVSINHYDIDHHDDIQTYAYSIIYEDFTAIFHITDCNISQLERENLPSLHNYNLIVLELNHCTSLRELGLLQHSANAKCHLGDMEAIKLLEKLNYPKDGAILLTHCSETNLPSECIENFKMHYPNTFVATNGGKYVLGNDDS
jgi:hypothetical protein